MSTKTADEIAAAIKAIDAVVDDALPLLGYGELTPIVDAVSALLGKVTAALAGKPGNPGLAADVAAADAAATVAEAAKFPNG
jgi:hypothetical protein